MTIAASKLNKFYLLNILINITISCGPLGAFTVAGVLGEGWVVDQARPVHQVEEVAVVGAIVQQGQSFRLRVSLHFQYEEF